MTSAKIVHLTSVHQPFDTRILYKECASLARAGYEVVLVAPYDQDVIAEGVRIRAVPVSAGRGERLRKTIWQVYRAALAEDAALYHFHDPELLPIGVLLKLHGKKVVYDIHENLPAQILGKTYLRPQWLRRLIASAARGSEKAALAILDALVIANPLVAERFSSPNAISLANYPLIGLIDDSPPAAIVPASSHVLIYVGGLTPIRGIYELIEAMALAPDDVELWLAGPWVSDAFRKQCESSSGWERVRYLGYLSPREVYGYLKRAHIGMATLLPQANYLTNLPVKGFEYMACSLPIVMSDFPYWREVFADVAVFVDPQSPRAIADAIQRLIDHPEVAQRMGVMGRKLVEERYSWEAESQKLLALYEQILEN